MPDLDNMEYELSDLNARLDRVEARIDEQTTIHEVEIADLRARLEDRPARPPGLGDDSPSRAACALAQIANGKPLSEFDRCFLEALEERLDVNIDVENDVADVFLRPESGAAWASSLGMFNIKNTGADEIDALLSIMHQLRVGPYARP